MPQSGPLHDLLEQSARRWPQRTAVTEAGGGSISYGDLAALAGRTRDHLRQLGVRPGDRVGLCLPKSIDAVAAIFGALACGAAYLPLDPDAPAARNASILRDGAVRAVVAADEQLQPLRSGLAAAGEGPRLLALDRVGGGDGLRAALSREARAGGSPGTSARGDPEAIAYLLYTSGSTGTPKGVVLSHRNATSFLDWCSRTFEPRADDCFSSHAPFHFDLSVLDLYLAIKHGGRLVLFGERVGKEPGRLAEAIAAERITVWYSVPSVLRLLVRYGELSLHDCSALRLILFAGEVFPLAPLRALKEILPRPRYFNLYGPTETNVCTFYELPERIPAERREPFPIGRACAHARVAVVDERGERVAPGSSGELCVSGPGVMPGYWNLPEQSARAFLRLEGSERWYRTGDTVREDGDGNLIFLGRRDRLVKRRGYRVELDEIEACLQRHPAVREAGVVALPDEESGVRIKAVLGCEQRLSIIALKRFCAENLPTYMVPDVFCFETSLPRTATDKIDYRRLAEMP